MGFQDLEERRHHAEAGLRAEEVASAGASQGARRRRPQELKKLEAVVGSLCLFLDDADRNGEQQKSKPLMTTSSCVLQSSSSALIGGLNGNQLAKN